MQKYSTIIGIIELRSKKIGFATTQRLYRIGSSTVTLIMKRFRELGKTLEEFKAIDPKEVKTAFYLPDKRFHSTSIFKRSCCSLDAYSSILQQLFPHKMELTDVISRA